MKKYRSSTIFSSFFDPKIPGLFVIGTFVTALLGNSAYNLILRATGGDTIGHNWLIVGGSIFLLVLIILAIKVVMMKSSLYGTSGENAAFNVPRKGVIYTVGLQTDSIRFSMVRQTPDYVGFMCSKETEPYTNKLIDILGLDKDKCNIKTVDPQNINEIRLETKLIIEWMSSMGLKNSDIAVDVTGGKTTMSVGAFSMAEELKIDTQYIKSDFDEKNKPIAGTQQGIFVKRYSELGQIGE